MSNEALKAYLNNYNNNSNTLSASPLPSSVSMGRRGSGGPTNYAPSLPSSASFISFDQQSIDNSSLNRSSSTGSNESLSQDSKLFTSHTRTTSNNNVIVKSSSADKTTQVQNTSPLPSSGFAPTGSSNGGTSGGGRRPKDTHFYDTKINYGGKSIPVRIPLQTFPEEVGEV